MEEKSYEKIWNFSAKPFKLEPKIRFKCPFHRSQARGIMERMYGNTFTFRLELHGDAEKQSHAVDTWMRCNTCGYTVVHGVAVPRKVYEEFIDLIMSLPRFDDDGKPVAKDKIPRDKSAIIFPIEKKEGGIVKKSKPMWQETGDIEGLRPLFKVQCKFCDREEAMFLRHSKMHIIKREQVLKELKISKRLRIKLIKLLGEMTDIHAFRKSYKCPQCDWLGTFVVPVRKEYFDWILDLRNGEPLYYPPLEDWKSEDKMIQEKLESLGYV